jgi:hypothetical protein
MPPRRPSTLRRDLLLLLLAVGLSWGGPRAIRSQAALQWVRYYAAQPPDPSGHVAQEGARWATTTMDLCAPLPWAGTAARLALDLGARVETTSPRAALRLYGTIRATLASLQETRWRGLGLSGLAEEVRLREAAARARPEAAVEKP